MRSRVLSGAPETVVVGHPLLHPLLAARRPRCPLSPVKSCPRLTTFRQMARQRSGLCTRQAAWGTSEFRCGKCLPRWVTVPLAFTVFNGATR
jgi:hypothetical protein